MSEMPPDVRAAFERQTDAEIRDILQELSRLRVRATDALTMLDWLARTGPAPAMPEMPAPVRAAMDVPTRAFTSEGVTEEARMDAAVKEGAAVRERTGDQAAPVTPAEKAEAELRQLYDRMLSFVAGHEGRYVRASEVALEMGMRPSEAKAHLEILRSRQRIDGNEHGYWWGKRPNPPSRDEVSELRKRQREHEERVTAASDDTAPTVTKDDVPEALSQYPAYHAGGPDELRLNTARLQMRIHEAIKARPMTAPEVAKVVDQKSANAARHLHYMGKVGLVGITGEQRGAGPVYCEGDGTPLISEDTWPDDLLAMPIALNSTKRDTMAVVIAMQQKRVAEVAHEIGKPFVIAEFEKALADIPRSRAQTYLNDLAEHGRFVKRTGKKRRARGQKRGVVGVEYVANEPVPVSHSLTTKPSAVADPTPTEAKKHEVPASHDESKALSNQERLNTIRSVIVKRAGHDPWTAKSIHDAAKMLGADMPLDEVEARVAMLADSGVIQRVENGPPPTYRYDRPTDPGDAARRDTARPRGNGRPSAGAPVPGTGRGVSASSSVSDKVLAEARKKFGDDKVRATGGGHFAIETPNEGTIIISGNLRHDVPPKDKTRLRRAGLEV